VTWACHRNQRTDATDNKRTGRRRQDAGRAVGGRHEKSAIPHPVKATAPGPSQLDPENDEHGVHGSPPIAGDSAESTPIPTKSTESPRNPKSPPGEVPFFVARPMSDFAGLSPREPKWNFREPSNSFFRPLCPPYVSHQVPSTMFPSADFLNRDGLVYTIRRGCGPAQRFVIMIN